MKYYFTTKDAKSTKVRNIKVEYFVTFVRFVVKASTEQLRRAAKSA